MKKKILITLAAVCFVIDIKAASRLSANYYVSADTVNAGGRNVTSVIYSNDDTIGGIGGISTAGPPVEIAAKLGYIGQLYEVTSLAIAATTERVSEAGTSQLVASATLDDGTALSSLASSVNWSVLTGPIATINSAGLATASHVYQDAPVIVQADYLGQSATTGLTVLNVGLDDYGSYMGDGIDDQWQVRFFGLNGPNAGPDTDPDGDGLHNRFEYLAGTHPLDAHSRFRVSIAPVPGQPERKIVSFSPVFTTRTYTVLFCYDLSAGGFAPLTDMQTTDTGPTRTVIDLSATAGSKFYSVQITFP